VFFFLALAGFAGPDPHDPIFVAGPNAFPQVLIDRRSFCTGLFGFCFFLLPRFLFLFVFLPQMFSQSPENPIFHEVFSFTDPLRTLLGVIL